MNIKLIKMLDATLGRMAISLMARPADISFSGSVSSILIIRPGGIGDAVLLVPSILAIRKQFPTAEITVLAERRNAEIFRMCPEVGRILLYDHPSDLITALRGRYDVVIDTEQWHRLSAVVARLCNASVSVGYDTNERSRLFNHKIPYSHDDYEAQSFLNLLKPLKITSNSLPDRFLEIPSSTAVQAKELLAVLEDTRFITIFPGARIPERHWGADRFRRVAELLSAFGVAVVVVGGGEDREQGNRIVAGGTGLNLAGRTSLAQTAGIIDRSALLLSGDSGFLHIAVGLDKPTVSLFGPGRAKKWAPLGDLHTVINKKLTCSPCTTFGTTPPCPKKAGCMQEITVDEVFNAVTILLTRIGTMPSFCCKKDWIKVE